MIKSLKHIALIALAACAVTMAVPSCNDNCMGNSSGIPLAAFYEGDKSVSVLDLTVYGIGAPNDSAIIRNTAATQVYLPLRISVPSCQYVLDYNIEDEPNDTITFTYDIIPYFESRECGAMYNFRIKEWAYTQYGIDSISIPNTMITNSDVVTIKIFMK